MAIIQATIFQCNRCGHKWYSQFYDKANPPVSCSACKSAYWNKHIDPNNPPKRGRRKRK